MHLAIRRRIDAGIVLVAREKIRARTPARA